MMTYEELIDYLKSLQLTYQSYPTIRNKLDALITSNYSYNELVNAINKIVNPNDQIKVKLSPNIFDEEVEVLTFDDEKLQTKVSDTDFNHIIYPRETHDIIDFSKVLVDKELFAKDLSQGNIALERLLLLCFEKNIIINSCFKGTKEKPAFLSFLICKENKKILNKLITNLDQSDYCFCYIKRKKLDSLFQIECYDQKQYTKFFETLFHVILGTESDLSLSFDLDQLYNVLLADKHNKDSPLQLIYQRKNNDHAYSIITTVSNYIEYAKDMQFEIKELSPNVFACTLISNSSNLAGLKLREIWENIRELNNSYDNLFKHRSSIIRCLENSSKDKIEEAYYNLIKDNNKYNQIIVYQPIANSKQKEVLLLNTQNTNQTQTKLIFQDNTYFEEVVIPTLLSLFSTQEVIFNEFEDDESDYGIKSNFYEFKSETKNKLVFGNFSYFYIESIKTKLEKLIEKKKEEPPLLPDNAGFSSSLGIILGMGILILLVVLFFVIYKLK